MVECLFKKFSCNCSLKETLEALEGITTDPTAVRRILGRACPNRPPDGSGAQKKKNKRQPLCKEISYRV